MAKVYVIPVSLTYYRCNADTLFQLAKCGSIRSRKLCPSALGRRGSTILELPLSGHGCRFSRLFLTKDHIQPESKNVMECFEFAIEKLSKGKYHLVTSERRDQMEKSLIQRLGIKHSI